MEVEILKDNLKNCLNIIDPIIKKNTSLPILSNILIETEKNFLKISATNLEASIIWRFLAKIKKPGKIVVPISFLKPLISFIQESKIILYSDNNNLIIKTENQTTQIQGLNPDEFPVIPKLNIKESIKLNNKQLQKALNQVVNIPVLSQIKPEISGIYFNFKSKFLYITATDSFRLVEKKINTTKEIKESFILPQISVRNLLNILSFKNNDINLYFNKNQILFEWLGEETDYPQVQFLSRLIEGDYPNYKEIIPKKYNIQMVLNKNNFINQIKKAGIFSNKFFEIKINIYPNNNKIKITSENPNLGKNESYIKTEKINPIKKETEISFNYKFILEGLNVIESSEVEFNLTENEGPASIIPVGESDFIYILMPVKNI